LNRGLLPPGHYALAVQTAGPLEPDAIAVRGPTVGLPPDKNPPRASPWPWLRHRAMAAGRYIEHWSILTAAI
jgi:hypothetical protein